MPIRYQGKDWDFEALAKHIAASKQWDIERARGYVAGIEKQQMGHGDERKKQGRHD